MSADRGQDRMDSEDVSELRSELAQVPKRERAEWLMTRWGNVIHSRKRREDLVQTARESLKRANEVTAQYATEVVVETARLERVKDFEGWYRAAVMAALKEGMG